MAFDRTTLLRGSARAVLGTSNLFAEGALSVTLESEREDRSVDAFGVLQRPFKDRRIVTTLTPVQWDNLAGLFPYASTALGTSVFGATDTALVITPVNGAPLTVVNAAITQMPGIRLAAVGSQFSGDVEITGLIANNASPASAASYYSLGGAAAGVALTGLDAATLLNASYSATYNGTTYFAEDGFEVSFDLSLEPQVVDGHGTVDMLLAGLNVSCRFKPVGATEAEILALLDWATGIGDEPTRYPLVISAGVGKPKVTLNNAQVDPSALQYVSTDSRFGEIEFTTARTLAAGALDPVFVVETETV